MFRDLRLVELEKLSLTEKFPQAEILEENDAYIEIDTGDDIVIIPKVDLPPPRPSLNMFDPGTFGTRGQTKGVQLNSREVLSVLGKLGYKKIGQSGSHVQLRHESGEGGNVTVPDHGGKDITPGTLKSIWIQAGHPELNKANSLKDIKKMLKDRAKELADTGQAPQEIHR